MTTTTDTQVGPGRRRQGLIYRDGVLGHRPTVPADAAELERRARRGDDPARLGLRRRRRRRGRTMRNNRAAFDRWGIVPRMAHGTASRDLAARAARRAAVHSPAARAGRRGRASCAADSDLQVARGRGRAGVPYVFSNQGCTPMEECAAGDGRHPALVPALLEHRRGARRQLLRPGRGHRRRALVVTLDTTMLGWRPQDLNLGSLPFAQGLGIAQYTSDPRFREIVARAHRGQAGRRRRRRRGHPRRDPVAAVDHPRTTRAASWPTCAPPSRGRRSRPSSTSTPTPG